MENSKGWKNLTTPGYIMFEALLSSIISRVKLEKNHIKYKLFTIITFINFGKDYRIAQWWGLSLSHERSWVQILMQYVGGSFYETASMLSWVEARLRTSYPFQPLPRPWFKQNPVHSCHTFINFSTTTESQVTGAVIWREKRRMNGYLTPLLILHVPHHTIYL